MAQALRVEFKIVTPLFMAGAEQDRAELRVPSLRGLLRFWYRAVDPQYAEHEPVLFGGTADGHGQSAVLLRLDSTTPRERPTFSAFNTQRFNVGRGKDTRNGLEYLGYPFKMGDNKTRQAYPAGHVFTLRCLLPRQGDGWSEETQGMRRRLVAALWLLGHFGGAGSRSRRGFGALALTGWDADTRLPGGSEEWPELKDLPLAAAAPDLPAAEDALRRGLDVLRRWFPAEEWPAEGEGIPDHPHLGRAFRFIAQRRGSQDWAECLAGMGLAMQEFRAGMAATDPGDDSGGMAPQRASFGLPLTFRYPQRRDRRGVTIVPYNDASRGTFERQGSLLLLHPLAVGDKVYPLFVRMDGAVPGQRPPPAMRNASRPLRPATRNAMDDFLNTLSAAGRP